MKRLELPLILALLVVAVLLYQSDGRVRKAEGRGAALAAQNQVLKAKVAEASLARRVDSVEVIKWETRTRTFRDTLNIHDTVAVKEFVIQTDTLRAVCLRCLASSAALQRASDSLSVALSAERDLWRQSAIRSGRTAKLAWPIALGVGVIAGAWIRGQ